MNTFERVAIFTLIENIENQLKGLKTLLAASAQSPAAPTSHKVHGQPTESVEMTDEEEAELERSLKAAREKENKRLALEAEAQFKSHWQQTYNEIAPEIHDTHVMPPGMNG